MKGDFLVDTPNPEWLDTTLQMLGAILIGGPDFIQYEGHFVVRCFGSADFVKFACTQQGYATVVRDAPVPAPWDIEENDDERIN
jgi:hypothetical protein